MSFKREQLVRYIKNKGPLLGVMVIFGGVGLVLLSASKADTPVDGAVASISLAPDTISVEQGQIVNISVLVNTNDQIAKNVEATVEYPAGVLELQSVQQSCIDPVFSKTVKQESQAIGKVVIGCNSDRFEGQHTVATLVFTALASSSNASITVAPNSIVQRLSDGGNILAARAGSSVQLASSFHPSAKSPRVVPNYVGHDVCDKPAPGEVSCLSKIAYDTAGQQVITPHANPAGMGPREYHTAYQLPCTPGGPVASVCATPATYGPQTIAIVDAGNYSTGVAGLNSDMQVYNQQYGTPPCNTDNGCLKVINQSGGTTLPVDAGWSDEISIDVTAVHNICQTCKIVLVEANDSKIASMEAAHRYAASLKPVAISDSWSGNNPGDIATYNQPGIAQIASAGDYGVVTTQNPPSDMPGVIAAGGTTLKLNSDGTRASEVVWTKSGGGCSLNAAAPSWQTTLPNWSTAGCGTKKAFGDLSADADTATGISIYDRGKWLVGGGTSLSAPLLAAMFGLSGGVPAGTVAPSILYANNTSANYFDVTSGNNCTASVSAHCTTGPGFDTPTGLGVPIGLGAFKSSASVSPTQPPPPPPPPPPVTPTPPVTPNPPVTPPTTGKTGDINGDGKVTITDMSILLSAWGTNNTAADLNKNGKVDITDLSLLLSNFGK